VQKTELLNQVTERLRRAFDRRLCGVVLYGSAARGEGAAGSDLDLLVLLKRPIALGPDLDTIVKVLYPLQLEYEHPIHALPVDEETFEAGQFALYRNAKREGLRL
jgi:predicted nucleotidyltransferase